MPSASASDMCRTCSVHRVEGANIRVPVLGQPRHNFRRRRRQMLFHQVHERVLRPVRVRLAEELCNLHGVLLPAGISLLLRRLVAGLCGLDQVDGDGDVLLQQGRELLARRCTVELGDGVADIFLVSHQPTGRRLCIGLTADSRHDVVARPHDVIRPELAHVLLQCRRSGTVKRGSGGGLR